LSASPAAAQRVIRGYGANEDFQYQAVAAGGYRQQGQDGYPQQRSSGNLGGGFLEFMLGGNRSPGGYEASYERGGTVRYNDPAYGKPPTAPAARSRRRSGAA
jgi:hypothetical protein